MERRNAGRVSSNNKNFICKEIMTPNPFQILLPYNPDNLTTCIDKFLRLLPW